MKGEPSGSERAPKQLLDEARSRGVGAWTQPQSLCGEEGARVYGWCSRRARAPPAPRSGNALPPLPCTGLLCVFKSLPSTRVTCARTGKVTKCITPSRMFYVCAWTYTSFYYLLKRDKASLASLKLRPVSKATASDGEEREAGERTQAGHADGVPADSAAPTQSPGSRERVSWQSKRSRLDPSWPRPGGPLPGAPTGGLKAVQSSFICQATGGCVPASHGN